MTYTGEKTGGLLVQSQFLVQEVVKLQPENKIKRFSVYTSKR